MSSEEPSGAIRWFGHAGTLDRDSRSVRFHGERGRGDTAETLNVAVRWEALEALEGQRSEVRDRARYGAIFEANRSRLEALAEQLLAAGAPLQRGYLVIGPDDL